MDNYYEKILQKIEDKRKEIRDLDDSLIGTPDEDMNHFVVNSIIDSLQKEVRQLEREIGVTV